ncbi:MAG: hypothetical protein LUO93_05920, partial [Methanomicrobiales archaeon]|nr:hypothetical protein [Methanomicrobiales archaeon]
GGNSLLETVSFGRYTARTIIEELPKMEAPDPEPVEKTIQESESMITELLGRVEGELLYPVMREMKETMSLHFGLFREEQGMQNGLVKIKALQVRFSRVRVTHRERVFNQALIQALELKGMLLLCEVVARGALARRESRGSHARTDYPARDDEHYLAHTVAHLQDGGIRISYAPVTLGMFEPGEREY